MNKKQKGGIRIKENSNGEKICLFCFDPVNTNGCILNCGCCMHLTCFISYLKGALRNKDDYFTEAGLRCISENHRNEPSMSFDIDELDQLIDLLNSEDIKILVMSNTNSNLNLNTNNKYNSFLGILKEKFERFTEHVNVVINTTNISNSRVYASIISRPCPCGRFEGIHYHGHYCHILLCGVCNIQYCVQCGGVDERIKALHNEDDNYILCRCAFSGRILGHTFCTNNDILKNLDRSQKDVPLDGRCGCPICPDCKPGAPCEYCPGGCVVCDGIVLPGPMGLNNARKWTKLKTWDCIMTLTDKLKYVNSVAFSFDGNKIVSSSDDYSLRVWDANPNSNNYGTCIKIMQGRSDIVRCVAWSYDGRNIVGAIGKKSIHVWNAESGEHILTLNGHTKKVWSVAYSPDNTYIVSGSQDMSLRIWDAITGVCISVLEGHTSNVRSLSFSPDGSFIVSGSSDGTLRIWDPEERICVRVIQNHITVMSVVYSHDGRYIISGLHDNRVVIWSAITGECMSVLEGHTACVRSVDYSYDGKYIVSGSDDNTLLVWDADRSSNKYGQCIYELRGHMGRVRSVSFSIDGRIVSGSDDNTIKIWELRESQNGGKKMQLKRK